MDMETETGGGNNGNFFPMNGHKMSLEDRIQMVNFPHKDGIIIIRTAGMTKKQPLLDGLCIYNLSKAKLSNLPHDKINSLRRAEQERRR